MVVVEYLYEDMKKLVGLPLGKVIDGLSALGAPSEYEEETKKIVTELTPNRPDWYSMEGLARALRAYYMKERPEYGTIKSDYRVVVDASVAKVRPYTACGVVKGLKLDDERIRDMVLLQEKLLGTLGRRCKRFGIGLYPLEAIEFPLRYTTMKPEEIRYTPLGFEKEMGADEILKEHKKGQQYGQIIRGFPRYPVFLDAKNRVMCLIPIVNSAETGKVDTRTTDIFIEVSGTDFNVCKAALNIIVCTCADMGGRVHETKVVYGKEEHRLPDLKPQKMKLDIGKVNKVLGTGFSEKQVKEYLERMGYGCKDGDVFVPPYRADIIGDIDIIEDVAIAHGYNNFTITMPDFFTSGKVERRYDRIDETMRGMGFLEVKTFILTNKERLKQVGYTGKLMEITNPSGEDYTVIRPMLAPDILSVFATNKMKGLPQKIYEIGVVEKGKRAAFGMMDKKIGFSDARGALQTLMGEIGADWKIEKRPSNLLEDETACAIMVGGKEMGTFGKVRKEILDVFGLSFDVFIFEMVV